MKSHYDRAAYLAELLDNKFNIFGIRFGFDPIFGLIPGGGDFMSFLVSMYIMWIGTQMNIPKREMLTMVGNIIMDFGIGLIPFAGDIADFYFKANIKNLAILKKYIKDDFIEGEVVHWKSL